MRVSNILHLFLDSKNTPHLPRSGAILGGFIVVVTRFNKEAIFEEVIWEYCHKRAPHLLELCGQ